ncbi:MAG: hypothetical protein QOJ32_548, partial [Frankiaceae bacterium]|nr:hypothetical protein [Frankiaceae bacterium]
MLERHGYRVDVDDEVPNVVNVFAAA